MPLSRRAFTSGALTAALGIEFASPLFGEGFSSTSPALAAIHAFAEADLAFNRLPGMTLGLVTGDGRRTILNFGYANADARTPITSQTLFQIGSISKVMIAAVVHQLVAEGRINLSDRISTLLPELPLPAANGIELQHLLDHVAGLADDPPVFAPGGLWTAYAPGAHWHYSNTGYEILGLLVERLTAKPLAQVLRERIFLNLSMSRSRGAIVDADRLFYAQGYEPADRVAAYTRGAGLAPAPWVDMTAAAGCVASTADDMLHFLLTLASAVQGKGGFGLSPEQARLLTGHAVPSNVPGMNYGNGLMHVGENGRQYLHHTGGMLSFSSSFHVDAASGACAFASCTLSAFADYRPRLLTRFAVDVLTSASLGRPIPAAPALDLGLPNAAAYAGRYMGPSGSFEIRTASPLTILAGGRSAPLVPIAEDIFRSPHPGFRDFSLFFERSAGAVALANYGPNSYTREGSGAIPPASDPVLARLAGRYINDNPWYGPMIVVERGGRLWIGTETPMTRLGDNLWRVGRDEWSPERAAFTDLMGGRPQSFIFSGVKFPRHQV
ncbi:MAG TPA: serine hydrolase [Sphingomicrobium sp.]|nr:serine hydrolase [Sphingomicrobium sp.]